MPSKERAADLRLQREYHITLDERKKVEEFQKGCCAICKKPVLEGKKRLAVDHCHDSGLLRGLLCWKCNKALGVYNDRIDLLKAAVEYLLNPPFTQVFGQPRYTVPGVVGTKKRAKMLKEFRESNLNQEVHAGQKPYSRSSRGKQKSIRRRSGRSVRSRTNRGTLQLISAPQLNSGNEKQL